MTFCVPTFRPRYITSGNRRFEGILAHDFGRAVKLLDGWRPKWSRDKYILKPNLQRVLSVLRAMARGGKKSRVAYDIETDGQHPLVCQIRCIAFYDGKTNICVPFLYRDGTHEMVQQPGKKKLVRVNNWKPYWSPEHLEQVLVAMRELFAAVRLDTQNGQYDRLCMEARLGVEIPDASAEGNFDTILGHHVVASYMPHGLGFLGSIYTEAPYYKSTDSGSAWSSSSDHDLWKYCADDVVTTWEAARQIRSEVRERPEDIAICAHDSWQEGECQRWRRVGIAVDERAVRLLRQRYGRMRDDALAAMRAALEKQAKKTIVEGSPLDALLAKLGELAEEEEKEEDDDAEGPTRHFNPASLRQLRLLLAHLGVPLSEETATGEISTAKEFLLGARKQLHADGKAKKNATAIEFLDYLFAWREASKLYSTYLYPEVLPDGRVHANYNVHVVPTGRLCIAGWTPVRTKRGVVRLDEIRVGDLVWTHKQRWRAVTAVHQQGVQEVMDARLSNGHIVTATTGHWLLGADGQWATLGELHERFKILGRESGEPRVSSAALPQLRAANDSGYSEVDGDDVPKCSSGIAPRTDARSIQSTVPAALLSIEDRLQESDARQIDGEASPVEGRMWRRQRVPDNSLAGETALRSRCSDNEEARFDRSSERNGGAPHQQRSQGQQGGQSRPDNRRGAQSDSLPAVEGQPRCAVEEVIPRGRVETYDLTVDEDESFEAAGIFSHNSSSGPNFQNQPSEVRGMFVAREGHSLVAGDWDALEMRLGGLASNDRTFIDDFAAYDAGTGPKVHVSNMVAIFGMEKQWTEALKDAKGDRVKAGSVLADKFPGCYRAAKVFAYACCVKSTPVGTLAGPKPIYKVKPGEWVWCWDGVRYVATKVKHVWKVGTRECVKVTMGAGPNGGGTEKTLIVTPDHCVMRRDGSYTEAAELKRGDRLMPFRRWSLETTGYSLIDPMNAGARVPEHRYVLGITDPAVHVHHRNEKRFDNRPQNLQALNAKAHAQEHLEVRRAVIAKISATLWAPENRDRTNAKLAAGRRASLLWRAAATKVMADVRGKANAAKRRIHQSKSCSECGGEHFAKGFCRRHYHQNYNKTYGRKRPNHVVLKVEPAGEQEVWDLEVEHPAHNFAVDNAVFIANCAYGAGPITVFEKVREEMPDMDFKTFQDCYARYKKYRHQLFAFQVEVVRKGTVQQYLDSPILGRRVHFFEKVFGTDSPEASAMQNMPMQSGGADAVSLANRRLMEQVVIPWRKTRLKKKGDRVRVGGKLVTVPCDEVLEQLAQVHDELLFEVPIRLAEEFAAEFKRVVEQPADEKHKHWRLPVDVKVRKPVTPGAPSRWKPLHYPAPCCGKEAVVEVLREQAGSMGNAGSTTWGGKCENKKCPKHEKPFEVEVPR